MPKYYVEGGNKLTGELRIHGAKNSVLPILAGTILMDESVIHNCPALTDVTAACNILSYLGCSVECEKDTVLTRTEHILCNDIPDELMREMRSSIVFLGAVIARCGKARISMPGGCVTILCRQKYGQIRVHKTIEACGMVAAGFDLVGKSVPFCCSFVCWKYTFTHKILARYFSYSSDIEYISAPRAYSHP